MDKQEKKAESSIFSELINSKRLLKNFIEALKIISPSKNELEINKFITENVSNTILFNPCDVETMVSGLQNYTYINEKRTDFIAKFSRDNINREMAKSILGYL